MTNDHDQKRAEQIVRNAGSIVGRHGTMRPNVARLVRQALAEGRQSIDTEELQDLRARLERTHADITEILNDLERYIVDRRKERLAKAKG